MPVTTEIKEKIIASVKKIMKQYAPPLVQKKTEGAMGNEWIGNVEAAYGSKKELVPGMYFASTAMRKDSVVFYFFPTYMNEKEFLAVAPNTYKCLKGKTCFHFKKPEDVNEKELNAMMKKGIVYYKKQGWIK
ncbi:MAG: hypothetical protein D4R43_02275 [Sphingobacteriales bacterium]|nr:MAG: hypothetical protein D4R43_02275 [Sphingobacteriales bacterium]